MRQFPSRLSPGEQGPSLVPTLSSSYCREAMLLGSGVGMVEAPSSAAVQVQLHPWAGALLLVVTSGGHISDGLGLNSLGTDLLQVSSYCC